MKPNIFCFAALQSMSNFKGAIPNRRENIQPRSAPFIVQQLTEAENFTAYTAMLEAIVSIKYLDNCNALAPCNAFVFICEYKLKGKSCTWKN